MTHVIQALQRVNNQLPELLSEDFVGGLARAVGWQWRKRVLSPVVMVSRRAGTYSSVIALQYRLYAPAAGQQIVLYRCGLLPSQGKAPPGFIGQAH